MQTAHSIGHSIGGFRYVVHDLSDRRPRAAGLCTFLLDNRPVVELPRGVDAEHSNDSLPFFGRKLFRIVAKLTQQTTQQSPNGNNPMQHGTLCDRPLAMLSAIKRAPMQAAATRRANCDEMCDRSAGTALWATCTAALRQHRIVTHGHSARHCGHGRSDSHRQSVSPQLRCSGADAHCGLSAAVGAVHGVPLLSDLHGRVDFVDSKIPKDYKVLLRPHQLQTRAAPAVSFAIDRSIDRTQRR